MTGAPAARPRPSLPGNLGHGNAIDLTATVEESIAMAVKPLFDLNEFGNLHMAVLKLN
jgi:hypothetical protein